MSSPPRRHDAVPPAPDTRACSRAGADAFDILRRCHTHLGERLDRLERLAVKLRTCVAFDDKLLSGLGDVVTFLDAAIPIHTADEEQTLFPLLRRHPEFQGEHSTPMDSLELEHHVHEDARLALIVGIVRRDRLAAARAAEELVAAYREHIRLEEEVLFPLAERLITDPATRAWMTDEMQARRRAAGLFTC